MAYAQLARTAHPLFLPLGLLARLPYAVSALATVILLHAATGSYAFAGAAAAAQSIAVAVGGLAVGRLADRFGTRRLGAVAATVNALATAWLLAAPDRGSMAAAATLVGLTQPQVGPLVRAHWSALLPERLLPTALAYEAAADETSFVLGPALVGALAVVSPAAPLVASAALLVATAAPFALLYAEAPRRGPVEGRLPLAPMAVMVGAGAAVGMVFGAVQTGVAAYAHETARPGSASLLYALLGLGSALAGLACAWLPARFTARRRYVTFTATLLLGTAVVAAGDVLIPMPIAIAAGGASIAPYMISLYAMTERLAPGRVATAMSVLCASGPVGTAAGQAVSGPLADAHGAAGALVLAPVTAAGALVLALIAAPVAAGSRRSSPR